MALVEQKINEVRYFLDNKNEPEMEIKKACGGARSCPFWYRCLPDFPKENTIFDIVRFPKAFDYYEKGIITFEQAYESEILKGNNLQQVESELKQLPPQINKEELKDFLSTLTYPLYFLDFETLASAVPMYDNSYPYEQIPFQYSLHYMESENGELKHKEFLAYPGKDPRRELAERLCEDIPMNVCVTAYNMSFEKKQISVLANLFSDLKEHLLNIRDNIKDLMIPFQYHFYYNRRMQGKYSIKYVLPALYPDDPSLDYHNLKGVHNGGEASATFLLMKDMDKEELEKWRSYLLKYCGLDTLAMVKVLHRLYEAVK
ncbi:MAG: DUF2779 domain-containing protein, partial [Treponema sp.]|nr:DUF2779 domain-containing protein [Treponema sp.]